MLLTGSSLRSLDDKQRFALPRRLRDQLGTEVGPLYLTPGTDGCLSLYPPAVFNRLAEQLAEKSPNGRDVRSFSRLFYAQAEPVELDSQGRIRLPLELLQLAGLKTEVMVVGVRDHIELWDRQRWEQFLAAEQARYDQLAETALSWKPESPSPSPLTN